MIWYDPVSILRLEAMATVADLTARACLHLEPSGFTYVGAQSDRFKPSRAHHKVCVNPTSRAIG